MMKSCSRCGKIHDSRYKCNANRTYNYERTDADKLRYTRKWKDKSKQIREESNYLCAVCRDKGIYNYTGVEVHHIIKLNNDTSKLLDDNNLICLCKIHHREADKGELSISYLQELVAKRYNN